MQRAIDLKKVPIHVLISAALKETKLGTAAHELALKYLSKWKDLHDVTIGAYGDSMKLSEAIRNVREVTEEFACDIRRLERAKSDLELKLGSLQRRVIYWRGRARNKKL